MTLHEQSALVDEPAAADQAPPAMRELTAEELLAVVGGPEIKNGGGGTAIVATPTN